MELACGIEQHKLLAAGVGGFFHFIQQDEQSESRQSPSIYVIITHDPSVPILMQVPFHVSFISYNVPHRIPGEMLLVEKFWSARTNAPTDSISDEDAIRLVSAARGHPHDSAIYFDSLDSSCFESLSRDELQSLVLRTFHDTPRLPFFCGVGFANPTFRSFNTYIQGPPDHVSCAYTPERGLSMTVMNDLLAKVGIGPLTPETVTATRSFEVPIADGGGITP